MKMIGCTPPYWRATSNLSRCQSKKQMKIFAKEAFKPYNENLVNVTSFVKPCIELKKITYTDIDTEYDTKSAIEFSPGLELKENETRFFIDFLNSDFKEIKESKHLGLKVWWDM